MSCKEPKLFVSHAEPRLNMAGKRMRIVAIDCGIKANIIRYFMTKGVELLLVPWDHDISKEQYDGLFVSNGPGDPTKCVATIKHLKAILDTPDCASSCRPGSRPACCNATWKMSTPLRRRPFIVCRKQARAATLSRRALRGYPSRPSAT